jgi:cysteine desulfurase
MIYLDYAATTPMSEQSIATYAAVAREYYGNASSLHEEGSRAKQVADASMNIIAGAMGAQGRHIHMVGGASEGNFLAIYALLDGIKEQNPQKKHILCSPLEHDSVAKVISRLQKEGWQIEYMPVSAEGVVSVSATEELMREDTALVVIQLVNSELGTLQPVKKIIRTSTCSRCAGSLRRCSGLWKIGDRHF